MLGKVRVGLIGLGAISFSHEAGFGEMGKKAEIVAMCDINDEEVNNRIGMYPGCEGYARYHDLLDNPAVELVDITVPQAWHYEIARAAIERGKHVLVEKPITVTSEQGAELINLAKDRGVKFSVAENTRFVTAYQKAEAALEQSLLGQIWTVRTLIAGSEVHRIKNPSLWHGKSPYGGSYSIQRFIIFTYSNGYLEEFMTCWVLHRRSCRKVRLRTMG